MKKKAAKQRLLFDDLPETENAPEQQTEKPARDKPAGKEPHPPSEPPFEPSGASDATAPPSTPAPKPAEREAIAEIVSDLTGKRVWVVDAYGLIYQVFHAMPSEMSSPSGEPVGAVYGFVRDIFHLLEEHQPDYLFVAYDMPGPTFRHEAYDQYKANRAEMPEELPVQIDRIRQLLGLMEIPVLGVPGYEADDVMATLAQAVESLGGECVLVTADKDCRQLLSDQTQLFNIRKNAFYDAANLADDWGIAPEQVVDFQALVGDTSDNVPGVPLIGPKVARQLIEQYGTLDGVLDHAEEVSGKKRKQNLIEGRDLALLSRRLVQLDRETPVEIPWDEGRRGGGDPNAIKDVFRELDFRSIGNRVERLFGENAEVPSGRPATTAAAPSQSPPAPASEKQIEATYHLVDTPEKFASFLQLLKLQRLISFDMETTSKHPRDADPVGYAFAWDNDNAWYVPVRAPEGMARLDPDETLEALRPILEDPSVAKIGQNLKYDMIVLRSVGVELQGLAFDTMVAAYLLEAGRRNHNLDDLAKYYLGHTTIKYSDICGKGKNQKRIDEVPTTDVADYAGEDAIVPLLLMPILQKRLDADELTPLWEDLERSLIDVLVELEYNGIAIDVERLGQLSIEHGERLRKLEAEIYELAGHEFNIASPKQLQQVLFEEAGLPVKKKTQTGASTDVEVLQELALIHPLPAKIIEYRQSAKLKNTYIDALPEMICPKTGRIHASFNQVVTATGRLSSSDPNLQNIPVRTEEGRAIRSAFVAENGDTELLAADYSQIELRMLAHFTEDERLCQAFQNDEDIHARVAGEVFGVPLEEVTKDQRRQAKAVNFGVIYGQSAFGLAKQLGIDRSEAAEFIRAYFAQYPGINTFLDEVLDDCRRKGYVTTILGRRRKIEGLPSQRSAQSTLAERTAINTVIQGSAADLIKRAMINVHLRLKQELPEAKMLLQIHDELVFEAPKTHRDALAAIVNEEMSGAFELRVPLKVDMKAGRRWSEMEPIGR